MSEQEDQPDDLDGNYDSPGNRSNGLRFLGSAEDAAAIVAAPDGKAVAATYMFHFSPEDLIEVADPLIECGTVQNPDGSIEPLLLPASAVEKLRETEIANRSRGVISGSPPVRWNGHTWEAVE